MFMCLDPPVHRNWIWPQEILLRPEEYPHRRTSSDPIVQKGKLCAAASSGYGSPRVAHDRKKRSQPAAILEESSSAAAEAAVVVTAAPAPAAAESSSPAASIRHVPGWPRGFFPFPHPWGTVTGCRVPPMGRLAVLSHLTCPSQ